MKFLNKLRNLLLTIVDISKNEEFGWSIYPFISIMILGIVGLVIEAPEVIFAIILFVGIVLIVSVLIKFLVMLLLKMLSFFLKKIIKMFGNSKNSITFALAM